MTETDNPVHCRIHRGCHEIGGNCVEIESSGKRIILDLGLPLKNENNVDLPDIFGLASADDSLLGLFISHPHPDHYGLLEKATKDTPVFMGEAARRIIEVSSFFTPLPSIGKSEPLPYSDQQPIKLGPFTITPFLMDHSAYDSHCFLIEVGGKRIFYSGDIRGHGRNANLFREFINNPPPEIDVLICEGTQIGRDPDFAYPDEDSVSNKMAEHFSNAKGMGLVWCSSQNFDRLISVWEAAKKSGRQLILDMYTAELIRAAQDDSLPIPGEDGVTVFLPYSQKLRIKREKAFHISNPHYPHRIYPEALADAASTSVIIFRPSMLQDLKRVDCLNDAVLISSVWSGYLPNETKRIDEMKELGVEHFHVHTSGHATVDELKKFVAAFPQSRIIPIHLEDRDGFVKLSPNVELKNDLEWWEV